MTPGGLLTTIGVSALGFGILVGGAGIPTVHAQAATPPAAQVQEANDADADQAQAYDAFVAALASELGDDASSVDAALRTALKRQVDERQAAGDLDAEQAAAMKAVIDVSDAPLFSGFGGHGGMRGSDGRGDDGGRGGRGGDHDRGGKASDGASEPTEPAGGA